MNTFADAIGTSGATVLSRTENGALTHSNSGNALVTYFFKAGASRGKNITDVFARAYGEDKELALRSLLWTRDIREGAGERQTFRDLLLWVEKNDNNVLRFILPKVSDLGRWDDLLVLESPFGQELAAALIGKALFMDKNGLCAKWMPRNGPVAVRLRESFGVSPKFWRKYLVGLTNVVEQKMCANEWDKIDLKKLPSLASSRYRKAFKRRVPEKFETFAKAVASGEVKVNAGAVYPYDVIKPIKNNRFVSSAEIDIVNGQWANLPDFVGEGSFLPIVDVSGSMDMAVVSGSTTAMDVALSLGLYLSERNKSAFKDITVTFSGNPKIERLTGSLSTRLSQLQRQHWSGSTNLQAAFTAILDHAVKNNVPQEDMPDSLIILSDMEFNSCITDVTNYDAMSEKYARAGYKRPGVVFWHLNARNKDNSPVTHKANGTALVSGFSPSIMKSLLAKADYTPWSVMIETIGKERYALVSA